LPCICRLDGDCAGDRVEPVQNFIRRQFPNIAGKPDVGRYASDAISCADEDGVAGKFSAADAIALIRQLQAIEARGPGRLVANKEWVRLNEDRRW